MCYRYAFFAFCFCLSILLACKKANPHAVENQIIEQKTKKSNSKKSKTLALNDDEPTLFGYRFEITGDFNGDGKKEKLTEIFYSSILQKEIDQFLAADDEEGRNIKRLEKWNAQSALISNSTKIDTLFIPHKNTANGFAFLKNEGDLDGDGADEISYVIRWADVSSLNTCFIMSYKNNQWQQLYQFPIWDWQLPDLPIYATKKDWEKRNKKSEELSLQKFAGLIKKIEKKSIQIIHRNEDAEEDTSLVNL